MATLNTIAQTVSEALNATVRTIAPATREITVAANARVLASYWESDGHGTPATVHLHAQSGPIYAGDCDLAADVRAALDAAGYDYEYSQSVVNILL